MRVVFLRGACIFAPPSPCCVRACRRGGACAYVYAGAGVYACMYARVCRQASRCVCVGVWVCLCVFVCVCGGWGRAKTNRKSDTKRIGNRIERPSERCRNPPKIKILDKPKSFLIYYKQARQRTERQQEPKEANK